MVPLGSLVEIRRTTGPDRVLRYNMFPAAEINGDTAPGFGSGQAIATMDRLAGEVLPSGMGFEWTDLAYQQILAGNVALFIFPICVLFVFLVLAAQYESWVLPLAIILIVPMCLLSAITGVWLRGMDNNILTQIGFVVLVALACKNAILIVEFANDAAGEGKDRISPAIEACRIRLRPILMTSFAFILGVLPLLFAEGGWGRDAPRPGHLGVQRHAGGDVLWVVSDAGLLCGHPLVRRAQQRKIERQHESSQSRKLATSCSCWCCARTPGAPVRLYGSRAGLQRPRASPRSVRQSGSARHVHVGCGDGMVAWLSGRGPESAGREALTNNHDIRIATARLREARALRSLTEFDRYPTVTTEETYTRKRLSKAVAGDADRDIEIVPCRL